VLVPETGRLTARSSRETDPTSSCSRWQSATWIGWPASRASSIALV